MPDNRPTLRQAGRFILGMAMSMSAFLLLVAVSVLFPWMLVPLWKAMSPDDRSRVVFQTLGVVVGLRLARPLMRMGMSRMNPPYRTPVFTEPVPFIARATIPERVRAEHEAAHVVAGCAMGLTAMWCDITPRSNGSEGTTCLQIPNDMVDSPGNEGLWADTVSTLSPSALFVTGHQDSHSTSDLVHARRNAEDIMSHGGIVPGYGVASDVDEVLMMARRHAVVVMAQHHSQWQRLATSLLESNEHRLVGDDIRKILEEA